MEMPSNSYIIWQRKRERIEFNFAGRAPKRRKREKRKGAVDKWDCRSAHRMRKYKGFARADAINVFVIRNTRRRLREYLVRCECVYWIKKMGT